MKTIELEETDAIRLDPQRQPAPRLNESLLRRPLEPEQYVSICYTERLAEAGIEPSVGSVGDSYDNALAESINGLFKAEAIHRQSWKNCEAVELATLTCMDWFNHKRLLEPIGNIASADAQANYYRQQVALPMATRLTPNSVRKTRDGPESRTIPCMAVPSEATRWAAPRHFAAHETHLP